MAGNRNYGRRVRRFSRHQRVLTDVQPSYTPPSAATAQMWGQIKSGLEDGIQFLRPAVEQEQTARGEREALEAYENGSFEMRSPLTIRSQAFNTTGERLITNRAMQRFEEGMRDVQARSSSVSSVQSNLQDFQTRFFSEMPNIPGLRARFVSQFERAEASMIRAATQRAAAAANAARRRAAAQTPALIEAEVERTALTAGTEGEVAAVVSEGIELLAADGPADAFTAAGVQFPPDPNRPGILRPSQIDSQATDMRRTAEETFLRAQILQSETPSLLVSAYEEEVFSGNADLPADDALRLIGSLRSTARQRESERVSAETTVRRDLEAAIDTAFAPYVVSAEAGIPQAMPQAERTALLSQVAGNPELTQQVELQLAVADEVVRLSGMTNGEQIAYIEERLAAFAATPGVDREEAAFIQTLTPRLTSLRNALTEEQVGVSAAEQAVASGVILDEDAIADLRVRAAGVPELEQAVNTIIATQEIITEGADLTGQEREQLFADIEDSLTALAVEGGRVGVGASRQLDALEGARAHYDALGELAENDATRFARRLGIELPAMPGMEEATLPEVAAVLAARIDAVRPHASRYGVDNPVPLSQSEREFISDWMQQTNNASRIGFMEQLQDLPTGQREAVLEALGQDNPPLLAAGRLGGYAPAAARAAMAAVGSNITVAPSDLRIAENATLAPFTMMGILPAAQLDEIRQVAETYAIGMAVRSGRAEITTDDLTRGFDLALGADDSGAGGIEAVRLTRRQRNDIGAGSRDFGMTILPPGVTGEAFSTMIGTLTPERLAELAGGEITDTQGRPFAMDRFMQNVAGFQPIGDGQFAPFDADGAYFATGDGVFTFSIEDLQ
jgi:hypothetical protein